MLWNNVLSVVYYYRSHGKARHGTRCHFMSRKLAFAIVRFIFNSSNNLENAFAVLTPSILFTQYDTTSYTW